FSRDWSSDVCSSDLRMKEVLKDIQDGTFVRNWQAEYDAGLPNYRKFQQADKDHPIEKVGKELRAKMVWLQANAEPASNEQTKKRSEERRVGKESRAQ